MLRVPSDENKENPSRRGGCDCNRTKLDQNAQFSVPKVLAILNLDPRANHALRDITSQKNYRCNCSARPRAKSSNEEYLQRDRIGSRAASDDTKKSVISSKIPVIRDKKSGVATRYQIQQDHFSPILPNCFTSQNTLISKRSEQLREPKVKKRVYKNYNESNGAFVGDIYNIEYLNDIFGNIRRQERKITLKENFLHKYNPDTKCRAGILNWILKEQAQLNFSESEYYLAVNLLDHVLANITVPINMYQLAMLSTLWISMKLIGSSHFKASTLIKLCQSAYLTKQLLKMEQKVLKIMDFKIHSTEPLVCVNYFLNIFRVQENMLAKMSVCYILDSLSLTPQFSSTNVSILAAACVKYTLSRYHEEETENINRIFRRILSREEVDRVNYTEATIFLQMRKMADENYIFKEPLYKYSKEKSIRLIEKTLNL